MKVDSLRADEQAPHLPMPVCCNADHLEPQPRQHACPDCGRAMDRCDRCVCAEAGIPPRGQCPCGEEEGKHYVNGVWYGSLCFGEMANERALHNILTRGGE